MLIFEYRLMIKDRKAYSSWSMYLLSFLCFNLNKVTWNTHKWAGIGDDPKLHGDFTVVANSFQSIFQSQVLVFHSLLDLFKRLSRENKNIPIFFKVTTLIVDRLNHKINILQ